MTNEQSIAAVLALVDQQHVETETDLPVPPVGTSPKGQALWYSLLGTYSFNVGEMVVLEALVATQSQLDEIEAAWRRDGSETTALGSTGQSVVEPRIAEMRQLRQQVAHLVKGLNLPDDGGQDKRRPGRPTRSSGGGQWGAGAR